MGSTELAANLFRTTQTEEKLKRDGVRIKAGANDTHLEVGRRAGPYRSSCPSRRRASSSWSGGG
jgi:hypothetical protein